MSEDIVTESGVSYSVTDKGQMLIADNADVTDEDDVTVPVGRGTEAADGDLITPADVPSILIPADIVIDVKKK